MSKATTEPRWVRQIAGSVAMFFKKASPMRAEIGNSNTPQGRVIIKPDHRLWLYSFSPILPHNRIASHFDMGARAAARRKDQRRAGKVARATCRARGPGLHV